MNVVTKFLVIIGGFSFLVVCGVSATANWYYGMSLGSNYWQSHIFGVASMAFDGMKLGLFYLVAESFGNGQWVRSFTCSVLCAALAVWSLSSATGFMAINVDGMVASKSASNLIVDSYQDQLEFEQKKFSFLSQQWVQFQPKIDKANKPLANRLRGDRQEMYAEIATSREQMNRLRGEILSAKVSVKPDAQASMFADFFGFKERDMQVARALALAVLLELVSCLGSFAMFYNRPAKAENKNMSKVTSLENGADSNTDENIYQLFNPNRTENYTEKATPSREGSVTKVTHIKTTKQLFHEWEKDYLILTSKRPKPIPAPDLIESFFEYSGLDKAHVSQREFNAWMRKDLPASKQIKVDNIQCFRVVFRKKALDRAA